MALLMEKLKEKIFSNFCHRMKKLLLIAIRVVAIRGCVFIKTIIIVNGTVTTGSLYENLINVVLISCRGDHGCKWIINFTGIWYDVVIEFI
jgi:hypothetical protein